MTEAKFIGITVIGAGRIGKVHISNLLTIPKVRLLYIVDAFVEVAAKYVQDYQLERTTVLHVNELHQALDDNRVDAVLVCTPTASHYEFISKALHAGKGVMCEKPFSFNIDEIAECYKTARSKNLKLFCAFNRRFDPQIEKIYQSRNKYIGKIKSLKITSRDKPRNTIEYLKDSGGMVLDQCIHDIDMLRHLTSENPESIFVMSHAHFDDIREIGDVDQLYINVKFPSGCLGHVDACREASYGFDNRIEMFGNKGMMCSENKRPEVFKVFTEDHNLESQTEQNLIKRYQEAYKSEVHHFVNVVKGTENLRVNGIDTLWVSLLCKAASHSITTGQSVNVDMFVQENYPSIKKLLDKWENEAMVNGNNSI